MSKLSIETLPVKKVQEPATPNDANRILLDVTKQFYCIRCAKLNANESRCEITIGNPTTMGLFKYYPICPACLGQLQDRFKPKPQQS